MSLRSLTTGALTPFEFVQPDGIKRIELPSPLSVTGTESYLDGVRIGLGIAQLPVFHVERDIAKGRLVRVLADDPVPPGPVSVLYPRNRQLCRACRVFIDWIVQQFATAAPRRVDPHDTTY